ncbi:hypothetical protein OG870_17445 [Streptomyces sp. NBC_00461]|uniref:hypothetical protein n=1 Tax=Streptomyces sp. NBC_00461 TaxID=2975750 RepID=UPI002E19364E
MGAATSSGGWIPFEPPAPLTPSITAYLSVAGWQHRRDGAVYRLRTQESYTRQTPVLLDARHIPARGTDAFGHLASLSEQPPSWAPPAEALRRLHEQDDLPARAAEFQLNFLTTRPDGLPHAMRTFFADRAVPAFPDSQLLVVAMAQELASRYALVRGLVSLENDPTIALGNGHELPAGRALATSGIFGAQSYLGAALNVLAPYVYAVPAPRMRAVGIWVFGDLTPGATWPSNQLVDALKISDDRFTGPSLRGGQNRPNLTSSQLHTFLTWWIARVNDVLALATDPARFFLDKSTPTYDPGLHWQYLASIERVLRDVAETMLDSEQNETARLRAAYDALDAMEGMKLVGFDAAVTPSNARKAYDWLNQQLPADVAAVALPACLRGVEALDRVKDGFSPGRYVGTDGLVNLPGKNGPVKRSWDGATAGYLRLDRNSAHSFLNQTAEQKAVLLSHNGHLPRGLANIALLWLIRLLADPTQLAVKLPVV